MVVGDHFGEEVAVFVIAKVLPEGSYYCIAVSEHLLETLVELVRVEQLLYGGLLPSHVRNFGDESTHF